VRLGKTKPFWASVSQLNYYSLQLPLFYDQEDPEGLKNLTIYRSSAGSGKTFTLVKDYLKLVLRDPENYRKILAITFTNKASEEMKQKILNELAEISQDKDSEYRKIIENEFNEEGISMQIVSRASTALNKILHNYGQFGVSTLDHFFSKVVRGFAHELDLPHQYDLDVDEVKAIEFAVEKLYEDLDNNKSLKKWLEDFAFSKMDADKGWEIDRNLKELGKELFKENFRKGLGDRVLVLDEFGEFVKQLSKDRSVFEAEMHKHARNALQLIHDYGLEISHFAYGNSSFANTFNKILDNDFDFNDRFLDSVSGEKSWFTKSSVKKVEIEAVRDDGLLTICESLLHYYQQNHRVYFAAVNLLKNVYSYGILGYIDEKLTEYRAERNLVLLSDHAFLLNDVIDGKDAPIIYEKIGSRYHHIMIDEFQDTSLFQWNNILPLVQNVLENFGNVLIVGDVKQSIYRWRGGDMKLLISGVQRDLRRFSDQTEEKQLDTNYRSAKNIVDFNNSFFATSVLLLSEDENIPEGETLIYDTFKLLKQKPHHQEDGYIDVRFFYTEEGIDWKEKAKDQALVSIKHNISKGYSPSDFLILVDKWDLGYEIADFLILNNYEVITDKSLKVMNNQVVQLLINAIKWLFDRDDQLAKTNLLFIYLQLQKSTQYEYHEVFSDIHNEDSIFTNEMPDYFLGNLKVFLRLPLYELVENLILAFKLGGHINNFVLRFQEICLEQSSKGNNDLHHFLNWWEDSKDDLVVITPENNQAIEIMTIHKAKGLQKPIIILPFANYNLGTKYNSLFWTTNLSESYKKFSILPLVFEKNLKESTLEDAYRKEYNEGMLERLNQTYVAFTRAEQQLYIFCEGLKNTPKDAGKINKLIYRVFDDNSFKYKEKWDMEDNRFHWGSEEITPGKVAEKQDVEMMTTVSSSGNPYISIRSESSRFFMLFDNQKSEKIKNGIIHHYLFERLNHKDNLSSVVRAMVHNGFILLDQESQVLKEAKKILEESRMQNWFDGSWKVINERKIISPKGNLKPDRVMTKNDETVIIDYKTGSRKKNHEEQMKSYQAVLDQMGYEGIRMYLVYFSEDGIVEVV